MEEFRQVATCRGRPKIVTEDPKGDGEASALNEVMLNTRETDIVGRFQKDVTTTA